MNFVRFAQALRRASNRAALKRTILAFGVSFSLSSCSAQNAEDEVIKEALAEDAARELQQAEIAEARLQMIEEGQGCEGRILQGDELAQIIVGKHHIHAPHDANFQTYDAFIQFWYQSDGALNDNSADPRVSGQYDVRDDQVCHQTRFERCFRFIENVEGRISKEILTGEYPEGKLPKNMQLGCVPLRIEEIGNGSLAKLDGQSQVEPSILRDSGSQNEDRRIMPNIEQLRRALKGRRAERKEAQASPIKVEEFHEDGTWSAIVEATIITKWDGRWDIESAADGAPRLCTTVLAKNSVQSMEPQTLCRAVKIHGDSSTISISDQMGKNIFSEYKTRPLN